MGFVAKTCLLNPAKLGWRSEGGGQMSEVGGQKSEVIRLKTEDRRRNEEG